MPFRFRRKEPVEDGFRRLVRAEAAAVISLVADHGVLDQERIHEARRGLQRIRSLLHLVKTGLSESVFTSAEHNLGEIRRQLGISRDRHVALECLKDLLAGADSPATISVYNGLRGQLRSWEDRAISPTKRGKMAAEVRSIAHALAQYPLPATGWVLISAGLEASYRHAKKAGREIAKNAEAAAVHLWRKRVKRLHVLLTLFPASAGKSHRKLLKRLARLGSILGEFQDLQVLREHLERASPAISAEELIVIREMIRPREARLLRKAQKVSAVALSLSATDFVRKMEKRWRQWRKDER